MNEQLPASAIPAHRRARASGVRTFRNGLFAVALVALPEVIHFLKVGEFSRLAFIQLAQSLLIVALTAGLNFLQRLHPNFSVRWHENSRRPLENSPRLSAKRSSRPKKFDPPSEK